MTPEEIKVALALAHCSYGGNRMEKRFAHNMERWAKEKPDKPLSERGRAWLWKQAWRYRRQLPDDVLALVPVPPGTPAKNARRIRAQAGAFFLKGGV